MYEQIVVFFIIACALIFVFWNGVFRRSTKSDCGECKECPTKQCGDCGLSQDSQGSRLGLK